MWLLLQTLVNTLLQWDISLWHTHVIGCYRFDRWKNIGYGREIQNISYLAISGENTTLSVGTRCHTTILFHNVKGRYCNIPKTYGGPCTKPGPIVSKHWFRSLEVLLRTWSMGASLLALKGQNTLPRKT